MAQRNAAFLKVFSLTSILALLGVLLFSVSKTENFSPGEKQSPDSSVLGESPSRRTSTNIVASKQTQGQFAPVQISEGASPEKLLPCYHLEKVTDPLVALQIAASRNDQGSIDHYLDLVVTSGDQAVPELQKLLVGATNRAAAKLYAYALSKIGTTAAVQALVGAGQTTEDDDMRKLIDGFVNPVKTEYDLPTLPDGVGGSDAIAAESSAPALAGDASPETLGALVALATNPVPLHGNR